MASHFVRRTSAALLAAGLVLVGLAGPASAHDRLVSSDPADGTTVAAVPAALTLEFSDEVIATGTEVVVTSGGVDVGAADAQVDGATVTAALPPDLANGEYDVAWRAVSADGHPIEGTFRFELAVPTPDPTPTSTDAATLASTDDDPSAAANDEPTDTVSASIEGEAAAPVSPSPEQGESPAPSRSPVIALIAGLAVVGTVVALILRRRHPMRGFGPPGQD